MTSLYRWEPQEDDGGDRFWRALGCRADRPETLPFSSGDVTLGSETELQVVVLGSADAVDLPLSIHDSTFFSNVVRRTKAGETSRRVVSRLERHLDENDGIWENSWVRFPERLLSRDARNTLESDLRKDKANPEAGMRRDAGRFRLSVGGEGFVRLPISYVLRLALVDAVHHLGGASPLKRLARRLSRHFSNDNTSPETYSFHLSGFRSEGRNGLELARETARRYLLTAALVRYANQKFELRDRGQTAVIYLSPHPPIRQKRLNDCISDSFYRELFMSPCLAWDRGEEKQAYMHLCHQVLSRSQLNAIGKLRDSGIITRNLVVLPNTSNVSLANNGTHLSVGSRKLTAWRRSTWSGFGRAEEKRFGDLAIKILEHFLPLFPVLYSATPYRFGFSDFHPELALGFLPHQLDFDHLRMIWRRWRKKAKNRFLGRSLTPFGPHWLDALLSYALRLQGDFIPDLRLIDYPVALMSTETSPGLDGRIDNALSLGEDLERLGVFDSRMSLYLPFRLREFHRHAFCGVEGRFYSQFASLRDDLARATDLQVLMTALAYKYIVSGEWTHTSIPDDPYLESERRQIFFIEAIGLPTFYVRLRSPNAFLLKILRRTARTRHSHRYPGYVRVRLDEYRKALLQTLREDGEDLIEMFGLEQTLTDLQNRLDGDTACSRLVEGILSTAGARDPFEVSAGDFNRAAEQFYRTELSRRHQSEAIDFLDEDLVRCDRIENPSSSHIRKDLLRTTGLENPVAWLRDFRGRYLAEEEGLADVIRLILVLLAAEAADQELGPRLRQVS